MNQIRNALADQIREEISRNGPISVARFMELALYSPGLGYYEKKSSVVGKKGDFYTSVSVGNLFGELLAFQFAEWLKTLASSHPNKGRPGPRLQIVEAGAHDGQLARDILDTLAARAWLEEAAWEYWIVEPSERRRSWQAAMLEKHAARVRWLTSWDAMPQDGVRGVIFSNELLDAFPIHRYQWAAAEQQWFEWGVGLIKDQLQWVRLDTPASWPLAVRQEERGPAAAASLPDGYVVEECPGAAAWWSQAAQHLRHGWLLTLDYGGLQEELFRPERTQGTLRAYRSHHLAAGLFGAPGEQDLTAHVNFSAVRSAGEQAGLKTELLARQSRFLMGIFGQIQAASPERAWTAQEKRQLQTLIHPEHLGESFKVLVQRR